MKVYQNHVHDKCWESKGYSYYGTMREARAAKREDEAKDYEVTIEKIDVKFTKAGILRTLNIYGGHPDNG